MQSYDLELMEIHLQNEKLARSINELQSMLLTKSETLNKEFYTLEECANLKGGAKTSTFLTARFMLPGCGMKQFEYYICGRLSFKKEDVLNWLVVDDKSYREYAKACGVKVIPEKYLKLIEKAERRGA